MAEFYCSPCGRYEPCADCGAPSVPGRLERDLNRHKVEVSRLRAENDRLRNALDFIASGTACGPVEVARVALGLKSSCDCRYCAAGLPSRCCIATRNLSPAESDRVIKIIARALGEDQK